MGPGSGGMENVKSPENYTSLGGMMPAEQTLFRMANTGGMIPDKQADVMTPEEPDGGIIPGGTTETPEVISAPEGGMIPNTDAAEVHVGPGGACVDRNR
jgi:hypothetical protein